jgi:SAM-dependent methyltransferase
MELFRIESVLDVGCGLGTWLTVFLEKGVREVCGIDGDYVDRSKLQIPENYFLATDLRKPFELGRKFDLVLSLEVAEHLPKYSAESFVSSLCRHSDRIVFSAAIPGQGGQNHLNEQWIGFWEFFFQKNGFHLVDAIRPKIWNEAAVDVWYRQNMFLFVREDVLIQSNMPVQMAEIHPALWKMKIDALTNLHEEVDGFERGHAGIKRSFNALVHAVMNKLMSK